MSKLSTRTKFAYGIGQVAEQIKVTGFDTFVFFYFSQVLGLNAALAGVAVGIALVFDGLIDPFTGALSDSWKSPRGRRHPFMYAALPVTLFWFAMFFPPTGLGQIGLFAWLTVFAILVRGSMTLFHVPHIALGAELSDDYVERTSVVAWRTFSGLLGATIAGSVWLAVFFPKTEQYANGLLNPAGYPKVALFGSIMMAVTIWYSTWGTRDQIARLPKAPANMPRITFASTLGVAWRGYREAMALKSFRAVFAGAACFTVAYGITQVLQTHMNVFFWEFSAQQYGALRLALLPGFLLGIAASRFAHRRWDKKACAIFGMLFITASLHLPVVLRLLGVLPHNGGSLLLLIIAVLFMFGGFAGGIAITTASSMMADVSQEFEYQSGRPQQGVLFSGRPLSQQIGSGVGHAFAGVGIWLIGFPTKASSVSAVEPSLIDGLGLLFLTAGVVGFAGVYAYSRYDLTHARHVETLKSLQDRKQTGSAESVAAADAATAEGTAEQATQLS